MLAWIRRNLDIYRSDFGRKYGWFVEWQGRRVAELVDAVHDVGSQFWHDYTILPLTDDPAERAALGTQPFWQQFGLVYINRKYGTRVSDALGGRLQEAERGLVIPMRALWVPLPCPEFWEFLSLFSQRK